MVVVSNGQLNKSKTVVVRLFVPGNRPAPNNECQSFNFTPVQMNFSASRPEATLKIDVIECFRQKFVYRHFDDGV
jgi:hypothetical protein